MFYLYVLLKLKLKNNQNVRISFIGCTENRLNNIGVKFDQQLLRQVSELAQEVHSLLGLLSDGVDVGPPLQVLEDWGFLEPEDFHSRHNVVQYGGGQCCGAPCGIHCHFEHVKLQVVLTTPEPAV